MKKSTIFRYIFAVWLGGSLSLFGFDITTLGWWAISIPTMIFANISTIFEIKGE